MMNTTFTNNDNSYERTDAIPSVAATTVDGIPKLDGVDSSGTTRRSIEESATVGVVGNSTAAAVAVVTTHPTTNSTTNVTNTSTSVENHSTSSALYSVPVKSEYILPERPSSLPSTQRIIMNEPKTDVNADDPRRDNRSQQQQEPRGRKNRGKQNKKRPRDVKISDDHKICRAILRGEPCPYVTTTTTAAAAGDGSTTPVTTTTNTCRYIHDLSIYLQTRPPDIEPITSVSIDGTLTITNSKQEDDVTCPIYQLYQYCPYGIMCRFGSCHIDRTTGQNIKQENGASSAVLDQNVCNLLSNTLQVSLRKNTYPFQCQRRKHERATAVPIATSNDTTTKVDSSTPNGRSTNEEQQVPDGTTEESTTATNIDDTTMVDSTAIQKVTTSKSEADVSSNLVDTKTIHSMKPSNGNTNYSAYPTKTRKLIDFANKVYVAPLTTVGNLPFRRIMKDYGADITCGEMALATNLLEGKASEWALIKRHSSETIFGIQLAAGYPDIFTRTMELIEREDIQTDFVDLNLGCPIDLVCQKGGGAALMQREKRLQASLQGIFSSLHKCPITIKMRTGWDEKSPMAHDLVHKIQNVWGYNPNNGMNAIMIHGRSRLQRYSREANWDYIGQIATAIASSSSTGDDDSPPTIPIIGNGDIFTHVDYQEKVLSTPGLVPCAMLGRGALIKPWLPQEIKEMKHYDISASERFDILRNFVRYGLEHWGTDQQGVNNCRRFLLEWLSFLHRYVPVGLLDHASGPQRLNQRPPPNLCGRNDLETLFMSNNCYDWIKISEMLLGPVPENFHFEPKHKANSY